MTHDPSVPPAEPPPEVPSSLAAQLQTLEAQVLHLQAALEQTRALFQESPAAALLLTSQGRIVDVNRLGAALLRLPQQALQGRSLAQSLPNASRATLAALLTRVFEGRGRQTGEVQLLTPDGGWLELALAGALQVREREPPHCHLTLTDVTAFKLAHRALWDSQQAQEAQLQDQARQFRQLREEFESVVLTSSRELEGTLRRAENVLACSRQQPDNPEALEQAQDALRQTRALLDSLKQYMQMRFLRARIRPVSLQQVLREALQNVQDQLAGRDVQLTSAALPTVEGDRRVLFIILHEYLSNALKFTRTRPQVRLRVLVEETPAEYRIGLEDNGVGFSMRQKDRAFELFGRLHPAGLYEGSGLGLAVVRRLCERFGGRAWAEGRVDQGATFWFSWPRVPTEK